MTARSPAWICAAASLSCTLPDCPGLSSTVTRDTSPPSASERTACFSVARPLPRALPFCSGVAPGLNLTISCVVGYGSGGGGTHACQQFGLVVLWKHNWQRQQLLTSSSTISNFSSKGSSADTTAAGGGPWFLQQQRRAEQRAGHSCSLKALGPLVTARCVGSFRPHLSPRLPCNRARCPAASAVVAIAASSRSTKAAQGQTRPLHAIMYTQPMRRPARRAPAEGVWQRSGTARPRGETARKTGTCSCSY